MVPIKFQELQEFNDDESIFGFYYKNIDEVDHLYVNAADWISVETYLPINEWCYENGVVVKYEAEASDKYFIEKGYEPILVVAESVKSMTIKELLPNSEDRLDEEDLTFSDEVFADIVGDDAYYYARILRIYHEAILRLLDKEICK